MIYANKCFEIIIQNLIGDGINARNKKNNKTFEDIKHIDENGDSRKKVIALAQTYFAVQTRKQEISEKEYIMLSEDKKIGTKLRFLSHHKSRKLVY